ncbi:uncharacterized protein ACJ7VT_019704 isoform 2-T2 [Polymixia lowei]
MTSRQHVSFGTGSASLLAVEPRGHTSQHGNETTDCEGGQAGLGWGASPNKSGDLGPPHQSAACSKVGRQALDVEPVPRSLETWDHHTSQLHAARWAGRPQKPGDHHTSQLQFPQQEGSRQEGVTMGVLSTS